MLINRSPVVFLACLLLSGGACTVLAQSADSTGSDSYHQAYYKVDHLNRGLPPLEPPVNLRSPQAAVETFVLASREQDFRRAGRALNLNLVPGQRQPARVAELAEKLYYVFDQELQVDWDGLPDRPDGQVDRAAMAPDALVGVPRRGFRIGTLQINDRPIPIRLQRVKVGNADPVWVFSANTVENIDGLFIQYGPSLLEQHLPDWAMRSSLGKLRVWEVLGLLLLGTCSMAAGWLVQKFLRRLLRRAPWRWSTGLSEYIPTPLGLTVGFALFYNLNLIVLNLQGPVIGYINPALLLLTIGAMTWLGMRSVTYLSQYLSQPYLDETDNYEDKNARRVLTYITVAQRVLVFLALLVGLGIALSQFDLFQTLGVSLLASAGVVSVLFAVAARPVLSNLVCGLQIALTQPVQIGDSVLFEGNWGFLEEIHHTYVVIHTWDMRRVMVPLTYFLQKPFENWSIKDSHMIKPIYLQVDYRMDVKRLRDKFEELLHHSELWDEATPPVVQVTGAGDETMEVRALCSARNPADAWNLHCDLREALMAYVQDLDDGRYLPRRRMELDRVGSASNDADPRQAPRRRGADGTRRPMPSVSDEGEAAER